MHQHEKLYHIGLCKADLEGADYAILPGDPGRVEKIAALMENAKEIGRNREYTSWLAETKGVKVLVTVSYTHLRWSAPPAFSPRHRYS